MHNFEREDLREDFEVEITDLEQDDEISKLPAGLKRFGSHFSLRWPIWRWMTVGAALILAFVVIQDSFPSVLGISPKVLPNQVSSPAIVFGNADRFYIDAIVPWAVVSLDGRPVHLPLIGVETPLKLSQGHHLLVEVTFGDDSSPAPLIASYLDRFGVLLTANDAARQLQPELPRADTFEQSIVQQLALFPGQAITAS